MFFLFCFTFVMILNIDHWSTVLSQFVPGLSAYIYALSIEGIQNTILLHVHYQRSSLRHHQPTMCPTIFFPFLLFTGRLWCSNPPSTNPTVKTFEHIPGSSARYCSVLLWWIHYLGLTETHIWCPASLRCIIMTIYTFQMVIMIIQKIKWITFLSFFDFSPHVQSRLSVFYMDVSVIVFVCVPFLFWLFVFLCFQSGKFVWHGCLGDWRPDPDSGGGVAASCWWRW